MPYKHRVLLGNLGDDIHTVGIKLIQQTLEEHGYHVTFLGIQNKLADFFEQAEDHEIILISSLNGHSFIYLQDFETLLSSYSQRFRGEPKIWYLGGNIALNQDPREVEKRYMQSGFTRVFVRPVGTEQILECLKSDLHLHNIKEHEIPGRMLQRSVAKDINARLVKDYGFCDIAFGKQRDIVLKEWKNGDEIRNTDIVKIHQGVHNLPQLLRKTKHNYNTPLIQPRTGVANIEDQQQLFKELGQHPMNISSVQLDAASRVNNFQAAEQYMLESTISKRSMLNGFPVPVHGPSGLNKIIKALDMPFQVRGGGPDHRFVYETSIAGGATGVEGGFICYLFPYNKDKAPSESLEYWKYVDALCGQYHQKHQISINREYFGTLTATLIEPSIPIAINIVQALISAKHGVKSITVGYAEQGNRLQDIAAIKVLYKLTDYYLRKNKCRNYELSTVFHQFMAAFPKSEQRSVQLIHESSITGALAGATKIMTKTPVESIKIPSVNENIRGVNITHNAFKQRHSAKIDFAGLQAEIDLIEKEVMCIMKIIEELGNGEYSRGIILAFEYGFLDIPFCPNIHAMGEVLTFRGINGAVRFANCELFPFPEAIKEFHAKELEIRKVYERESSIAAIISKDVTRIWNEDFKYWPLDVESLS